MNRYLSVIAILCIINSPSIVQGAEGSDSWVYQTQKYETIKSGQTKLMLKTKWRDKKMHYIFTISPVDETKLSALSGSQKGSGGINLLMKDKDGFNIVEIFLSLRDFANITAPDSDSITGLEANKSVECSLSTYKTLKSWGYTYNYDIFVDDTPPEVDTKSEVHWKFKKYYPGKPIKLILSDGATFQGVYSRSDDTYVWVCPGTKCSYNEKAFLIDSVSQVVPVER